MKLKMLALAVVLAVFVQGAVFTQTESAETWNSRGIQYYKQGNFAKAIECFLKAKYIYEKVQGKEHTDYAQTVNNLGLLYWEMGDYAKAERCYLEAKYIFEKVQGKQHLDYATLVNNLGLLYFGMGDYVKAERFYLEAKSIYEKVQSKDSLDYAQSLNNLGELYRNMGNYIKAERYLLEAISIYEKVQGKEHSYYAKPINNLGELYRNMGDYAKAEHYFLVASAILEKVLGKEHPDYAKSLNNLGASYWGMGDFAKAERYFLEASTIWEKVVGKEHPDYAKSLNNLGELYNNMSDYANAGRYHLEAGAIREKALGKEHPDYAQSLNNLGVLYSNMGDYTKAERCLLEASAIWEKALGKEHPDYAQSLNNLGELYRRMDDYAKAEHCLLEASAIWEKVVGKEHPDYAKSLNNLGLLYWEMDDYTKAEHCLLEASAIWERTLGKEHSYYSASLANLYVLYLGKKEYTQALAYKQEQIKIETGLVNQIFSFQTEQQRDAYWDANSSFFEGNYTLSFFSPVPASNILNYDNALFSKGLLLRTTNAVRDFIYSSGNQTLITQFEELGHLRQQINALLQSGGNEVYIQSLETQAEALDKFIARSSAAFREFQADLAVNWQSVQKSLRAREAAIEFVSFRIFDKRWTNTVQYAALVVKPGMNAPAWVPLCEEATLTRLFDESSGWGSSREEAERFYDKNGSALYNAVWQPLEKVLENDTTVYYSPSGLLHKISFNAIPVKGNTSVRLMDMYDLNLVSSTREVVHLNRSPVAATQISSAVLYGGLEYNIDADTMHREALAYNVSKTETGRSSVLPADGTRGDGWDFLGGSLNEIMAIERLLKGKQIRVILYSGVKGNKESFKALNGKRTSIIHLATHGFFMEEIEKDHEKQKRLERLGGGQGAFENPLLRSGLILAGGNNAWNDKAVEGVENGILFADDVAKMNLLGTELVALSACVTALGKVNNSEGVFGLQRAFKLAGAQTLIMSLWKVNDDATAILMNTFYQEWLFSGKSKQAALKEAQKKVRAVYPDPYYWAAFVMMD
jgi:CHAT domain-containing protein/Flp pilus assembly protein TadD